MKAAIVMGSDSDYKVVESGKDAESVWGCSPVFGCCLLTGRLNKR